MKSNKKIYTTLLIFSILSLLLILFFIWLLLKEIKSNSSDLISAKNDIVVLEAQAVETENFKKVYQIYKPNLERIERLFFNSDNPVDFIQYLENTALIDKVGLKISSPSLSASSQQSTQNFVTFQLIVTGNFSNVLNFLKRIENGHYLIETTGLTIQNSQEDEEVNATITIKVFIMK